MSETLMLVGTRIRDIRKSKGLSQEASAEKAGFNASYIGFIERAERNISLKNLDKIAAALNVGIHQLFTYIEEQEPLTEEDSTIKEIISMLRFQMHIEVGRFSCSCALLYISLNFRA
ncbi:helix-turn-helix transcriptional regulator [Paenibacillus woosongensis]|uniref:Helix-turn-helix transcriptional regulator n=1 Tax=Paenibacillus woosongensis TaxID=307580 RepID=A0AA95I343_9BACL|nr:helix-turn-helix transcriptional regulator [Paenibacillus woosongensis]WHX49679.1 helix-turn-helix transcriptional regulator [Paenibacillus woosongensis]